MRHYRHTQIDWVAVVGIALTVVFDATVVARVAENLLAPLLLSLFLLSPLLFLATFTVTVTDDDVILRSGVGLLRTRIPVLAVRSYERVLNPRYYWGMYAVPRGTLYNTSGFQAVEVTLVDGTHLRIGTNEPDAFIDALGRVVRARAAAAAEAHVSQVNPILEGGKVGRLKGGRSQG